MKHFRIDCGVSRASSDDAIAMDVQGAHKTVNLRIDYITRTMRRNVSDLLVDLLEVAAYIYCADQRLGRGSNKLTNFGENWRRDLHFAIPVRCPEFWGQSDVHDLLAETLGFLSDDSYTFEFRRADAPSRSEEPYFPNLIDASMENDEVALFSGGVDSFAGAVNDIVTLEKSITLVGHCSSTKVRAVQEVLIEGLKQRGVDRRVFYVPVWVSNEKVSAREFTQRTRSFLFACLGLVIARLSGKDHFSFYENGVVSINPPLAADVLGGRATRTTHPKVLRGLEELFSALVDRPVQIRTPLQWLTKSEVVLKIREAGMADLLAMTSSCTRPRTWTQSQKHCGVCSQCIDRRFAILAAGMAEFEAAGNYMVDLLLGDRSTGDDMRMALGYVSSFQKIGTTSKERFVVDFPEVASALGSFPGLTADQAGDRLYDLFQRQARAVEAVIAEAVTEHARALYRNELPSASLLAICFSPSRAEAVPPSDYDAQTKAFMDRLATPVLEFALDAGGRRVLFRGGTRLQGASFEVVNVLVGDFRAAKASVAADVPFMLAADLADELQVDEQSMRRQLSRLRKELDPLAIGLGIPLDQDTFIETKERAGYRLNPSLREISVADINADDPPPTCT